MMRRTNNAGGFGAVLAKGDADAGGILVIIIESNGKERLLERGVGPDGNAMLIDSTPAQDLVGYWQKRRSRDPDLWVIELNIPEAERLVAEMLTPN